MNSFNTVVCLNCSSQSSVILQKPHDERKSYSDSFTACMRACMSAHARVYGPEQTHSPARGHWTENLLIVQWTLTTVRCVCVCLCVRAHMSTIRLMFINTFCCVEWNCSEPWHNTAYFWGLNVHAWVCVLAWPTGTTELSLHSKAPSATVSDWWLSKLLIAAGGTSYKKEKPLQKLASPKK